MPLHDRQWIIFSTEESENLSDRDVGCKRDTENTMDEIYKEVLRKMKYIGLLTMRKWESWIYQELGLGELTNQKRYNKAGGNESNSAWLYI